MKLKFLPVALKKLDKVDPSIKNQFKKKLAERLENPQEPSAKLCGYDSVYKIKLRTAGYRLAYEVIDDENVVYVPAIGKRDKAAVYKKMASHMG